MTITIIGDEMEQKVEEIDQKLAAEILAINQQLEVDIQVLRQDAGRRIDELMQITEQEKKNEVYEAARAIQEQAQMRVQEIETLALA